MTPPPPQPHAEIATLNVEAIRADIATCCLDFNPESGRCADRDRCKTCGWSEASHELKQLLAALTAETQRREALEARWRPVADRLSGTDNPNLDEPVDYVDELFDRVEAAERERDQAKALNSPWRKLGDSVQAESDQIQTIAESLKLPRPVDRGGHEGPHTAFTVIHALRTDLAASEQAREALRTALERAGIAIHSEYCGRKCHEECAAVTAAIAAGPSPDEC